MFRALKNWVKAFLYLITGQIDAARRTLDTNPHVMRAKYDEIVRDKTSRVNEFKQAVAALVAQQEKKMARLESLNEDVKRLEDLKTGALAKAKQEVERLTKAGKNKEQIQSDPDYRKLLAAFQDFSSTLAEKQAHIEELEQDVEAYRHKIGEHKIQLQAVMREIEKLKTEAADAVAEVLTANQEKEMADMLTGLSQDGTAEELARLRDLRHEVKAEARISKELAGTDTAAQEREFLEFARQRQVDSEFDALVGLSEALDDEAAGAAPAAKSKEKLPE